VALKLFDHISCIALLAMMLHKCVVLVLEQKILSICIKIATKIYHVKFLLALKRIGRYLKGTINEAWVLHPSDSQDIDCYVDADFAGLWPHEDKHIKYPTGLRWSRLACPVLP
jgi:hypothetical protein